MPKKIKSFDLFIVVPMTTLVLISILVLKTLNPTLFPQYYFYIIGAFFVFFIFSSFSYELLSYFSIPMYIFTVVILAITFIAGSITRGTVRWLNIGALSIQPSELVRPLLLISFSNFLVFAKQNIFVKHISALLLIFIPVVLIAVQPSLGVSIITIIGLLAMYLKKYFSRKIFIFSTIVLIVIIPIIYTNLQEYQKNRIVYFLSPSKDSKGLGYNTIQAIISVGSGGFFGKGLGKGDQTQLRFLPEKHTDFVFASISEELGFVGSMVVILCMFVILFRLTILINETKSESFQLFIVGIFTVLFVETIINIGMNIGIMPITGVPLPLVSAGGSSLLATVILLSLVVDKKAGAKT